MTATIHHGNCLDVLRGMPDNSVDAICTDPPYGLSNTTPKHIAETMREWVNGNTEYVPAVSGGFMGAAWDSFVPPPAVWEECFRVLKPGGHLATFAGTRTLGIMDMSVRLAGFDHRDTIGAGLMAWVTGQGFPKSQNIAKKTGNPDHEGLGTALKPSWEPILVYRKPLAEKTVAANVQEWGTGAINIDATRIRSNQWDDAANLCNSCAKDAASTPKLGAPATKACTAPGNADSTAPAPRLTSPTDTRTTTDTGCSAGTTAQASASSSSSTGTSGSSTTDAKSLTGTSSTTSTSARPTTGSKTCNSCGEMSTTPTTTQGSSGRWPSNVVLDEHQAHALDLQSGNRPGFKTQTDRKAVDKFGGTDYGTGLMLEAGERQGYNDEGGASRFFYCAKASKRERPNVDGVQHPTVKPVSLMSWLVKLLTPPGGTVLDPFAGSGTTIEAAIREGFHPIGIEAHGPYLPLIRARIDRATPPDPEPVDDLLGLLGDAA